MAASVKAIWAATLLLDEVVASGLTAVVDKAIRHDFAGISNLPAFKGEINANTSPAITKGFSDLVTIVTGGTFTLDLTALDGPSSTTRDFTGLKVQFALLAALTSNIQDVVIKTLDTSTGYNLFGAVRADADQITLAPGEIHFCQRNDKGEDVDATHKDIKFTAGNGNIVAVVMVAG